MVRKYADTIFRVAYAKTNNAHDAADIMQEVFLRYLRSRPLFESEQHEKAWFLRVAVNCSKNLFASAWFQKTQRLQEKDAFHTVMQEESEVYYAVAALPPQLRMVIHLYYYEDCPVREIASILSKSESSVKSALFRARRLLKISLEQEAQKEEFFRV